MNALRIVPPTAAPDLPGRSVRMRAPFAGWRSAVCAVVLCAIAHAQDDPMAVERVVAADAARLLKDADPVVRGEAALIVAAQSDPSFHSAIVAMARDHDDGARLRGIVALGLQATPGVAVVLDEYLADPQLRDEPVGIAAAFALGLLPPGHAPSTTSRALSSFLHGNLRRQRDALLALLLGMTRHDQATQVAPLRRLLDDESLRDPVLRAQLLAVLLPVDPNFDGRQLRRLLERGSEEERSTLLNWLANNDCGADAELAPLLERMAGQSQQVEERVRALAVLTRMRHLPALEIAARALRGSNDRECGQAMRTVLAIGGASMRGALERRLLDETDPTRKAAMLANFDAPPSKTMVDECARLAADGRQPPPLRIAAARLLARTEPERARPLLRDLFRATEQEALLQLLVTDLMRGGDLPPLERLLDGAADLRLEPRRFRALLAAEHPGAIRELLIRVASPTSSAATRASALASWRQVRVLRLSRPAAGSAPEALVTLLGS